MKKLFFVLISSMWILYFIACPEDAFLASCDGILLWFYQILPALLPWSILSCLLISSGIFAGKRTSTEWFVILCGFLFGFPMGSKMAADFCREGLLSRKRAQLLCIFTNNLSPVFVSTFVLGAQLQRPDLVHPTWMVLYGVPLILGIAGLLILHRKYPYTIRINQKQSLVDARRTTSRDNFHSTQPNSCRNTPQALSDDSLRFNREQSLLPVQQTTSGTSCQFNRKKKKPAQPFDLNQQVLDTGILKSFETMIRLCGYIVMFSILSHMIAAVPLPWEGPGTIAAGVLEVTNGIVFLARCSLPFETKYLLAIAMTAFGGLSGAAQTGSMIRGTGLSLRIYLAGRILLAILTTAAAWIFVL